MAVQQRELTGIVKRIVSEKGFGFIEANGADYFFHRSACADFNQLSTGDRVTFVAVKGQKGPRAESVQLML